MANRASSFLPKHLMVWAPVFMVTSICFLILFLLCSLSCTIPINFVISCFVLEGKHFIFYSYWVNFIRTECILTLHEVKYFWFEHIWNGRIWGRYCIKCCFQADLNRYKGWDSVYRLRHLNLGFFAEVQAVKLRVSISLFKDRCLVPF